MFLFGHNFHCKSVSELSVNKNTIYCSVYNIKFKQKEIKKYQPSLAGGTLSRPVTPHRLQHDTACKMQNGQGGTPKQNARLCLLLSTFDLSTPSMRKVDYAGNGEKQKEIITEIVATNVVAS